MGFKPWVFERNKKAGDVRFLPRGRRRKGLDQAHNKALHT